MGDDGACWGMRGQEEGHEGAVWGMRKSINYFRSHLYI